MHRFLFVLTSWRKERFLTVPRLNSNFRGYYEMCMNYGAKWILHPTGGQAIYRSRVEEFSFILAQIRSIPTSIACSMGHRYISFSEAKLINPVK